MKNIKSIEEFLFTETLNKELLKEDSDVSLTPRQKIAELGHKQNDLKSKNKDLADKMREKPEQRQLLSLQMQLNDLKIKEMELQRKIATYKL